MSAGATTVVMHSHRRTVTVFLIVGATPIVHDDAEATYVKDGMFCVGTRPEVRDSASSLLYRYPLSNIFRIVESNAESQPRGAPE